VRLSGQDAQRGTFSHRHAVLTCQRTGKRHVRRSFVRRCHHCSHIGYFLRRFVLISIASRINPLDVNLRAPNVGRFEAINSPLSEAAVMSFDYGAIDDDDDDDDDVFVGWLRCCLADSFIV
jgi:2-oxoglutarate dehydrogenase complex dehydrogenase (E1) component-like enzyme